MQNSDSETNEDHIRENDLNYRAAKRARIKTRCEGSLLDFTRYFFKKRQGMPMIVNWHHHFVAEELEAVIKGATQNLVLNMPPGSTKCIEPMARVFTRRGMVYAKDIRRGDIVMSHDNGKMVFEKCLGTEPARKESLKIFMRSGRSLIMSHDHPMLSLHGYKKASELEPGERIRCLAAEWDGSDIDPIDEIAFATYMIFEGNCTSATIRWSGQDNLATSDFLEVCSRLGIVVKKYPSSRPHDFNIMGGASGIAAKILKRYGLWGCTALEKRIPANWMATSLKTKYRILSIMFATDGYYSKNSGSLGVALANHSLIQDIQHLLSTCGIASSHRSHKNGHAGYTRLRIPREHTEKLLPHINMFHKEEKVNSVAKKKHQSYLLAYPKDILRDVKGFWYWSKMNGKLGAKKSLTQATFDKCAEKFPELEKFRNTDFYWDEIIAKEPVGQQDLIHLSIERTKNFVVEGLVSHNTEMGSINMMAYGLALNSDARFLHLSSGDDLVLLNSQTARDIVASEEYQSMWPMRIAEDASAKKRWNVMRYNRKCGGVYAVALGGQITGFRAGRMTEGWQGAIIVDDPLKADDAFSAVKVKVANRRILSTVKSRKANPKTPMIVIMQRVGAKDVSGFIKAGNVPGHWKFVVVPALIDDAYIETLPPHIQEIARRDTASSPRDERGRFSYWQYKEPLEELLQMESGVGADSDGNRVSRFVFASQYQQAPTELGGGVIKDNFQRVGMAPKIKHRAIYGDTAQKTAERNDYSVFECWGFGEDGKIYLLDIIRGKWEAPDLKRRAREFWAKHNDNTLYPWQQYGRVREMKIEDKASGTGLIQDLKRGETLNGITHAPIPVKPIERHKDKLTRVMDVLSYIEAGMVCVLDGQPWLSDFIAECEAFTADDTHAHDDQIDPMCDAISDLLGAKPRSFFI